MKKIISLLGGILILISLSGCIDIIKKRPETRKAERVFQEIIVAFDNRDTEALIDMFSPKVQNETEDLDDGISYIFSIYEGKMKEFVTYPNNSSNHWGSDGNTERIEGEFRIITDKQEYMLDFCFYSTNQKDENMLGVFCLKLVTVEEFNNAIAEKAYQYSGAYDRFGVYYPKWDEDLVNEK